MSVKNPFTNFWHNFNLDALCLVGSCAGSGVGSGAGSGVGVGILSIFFIRNILLLNLLITFFLHQGIILRWLEKTFLADILPLSYIFFLSIFEEQICFVYLSQTIINNK